MVSNGVEFEQTGCCCLRVAAPSFFILEEKFYEVKKRGGMPGLAFG
nr:MAG TPA_asm: hypothetical protein [Bacteriophage sp.]DAO94753.1 MAG TPA: hypothetical protein [Caudoviricetes sp.]